MTASTETVDIAAALSQTNGSAPCLPCEAAAKESLTAGAPAPAYSQPGRLAEDLGARLPADITERWAGILGVEGELTGDGRLIQYEALRWAREELPIPLRYVSADMGAHQGAVVVGRIDTIERLSIADANERLVKLGREPLAVEEGVYVIWGEGDFDLGSTIGKEAHRQVDKKFMTGVSMDLDDVAFEVRIAAEAAQMAIDRANAEGSGTITLSAPDADGRVTVKDVSSDDEVMVTTGARIRAATIVAVPAFSRAQIGLVAGAALDANSLVAALHPLTSVGSLEVGQELMSQALEMGVAVEVGTRSDGAVLYDLRPEADTQRSIRLKFGDATFEVGYPVFPFAHEEFNWVEDVGGLPKYIKRIAKHLIEKGKDQGHAIAIAVNVVKKMCATGDLNFPGKQSTNAASRAEACAAVAEWEAKKKAAKASAADSEPFSEDTVQTQTIVASGQWSDPNTGEAYDLPATSLQALKDMFPDPEADPTDPAAQTDMSVHMAGAGKDLLKAVAASTAFIDEMGEDPNADAYMQATEKAADSLRNVAKAAKVDPGLSPDQKAQVSNLLNKVRNDLAAFESGYDPAQQQQAEAAPDPEDDPAQGGDGGSDEAAEGEPAETVAMDDEGAADAGDPAEGTTVDPDALMGPATDLTDEQLVAAITLVQAHLDQAPDDQQAADRLEELQIEASSRGLDASSGLQAAAPPVDTDLPPARFFDNPKLTGITPMTITDEGRVYGHLATWGTCHLSYVQKGKCVTPPKSRSGYAYFHTGSVLTAEGAEIPVGQITLDTGHAEESLSAGAALAHYDNTGMAVADIVVGEDSHGIWYSGALRPGLRPADVRTLRASPLSGDWRRYGVGLEMVAALAVNVQGFPVPRPKGRVRGGSMVSLVAAGMIAPSSVPKAAVDSGELSADDLRYLKRLAAREAADEAEARLATLDRAASLARQLRAQEMATRVASVVPGLAIETMATQGQEGKA